MSDAAYEQRHKKHERAEKRLRRLEREALVRDRRRLEAVSYTHLTLPTICSV